MKYIDIAYKGSYAENTVKSLDLEGLKYRRGYTVGAINYHKKERNEGQIKFFSDELRLIDKKIKQLQKKLA